MCVRLYFFDYFKIIIGTLSLICIMIIFSFLNICIVNYLNILIITDAKWCKPENKICILFISESMFIGYIVLFCFLIVSVYLAVKFVYLCFRVLMDDNDPYYEI